MPRTAISNLHPHLATKQLRKSEPNSGSSIEGFINTLPPKCIDIKDERIYILQILSYNFISKSNAIRKLTILKSKLSLNPKSYHCY